MTATTTRALAGGVPRWLLAAAPVTACVVAGALLLESAGGPGRLDPGDFARALWLGGCLLVAVPLPLTAVLLTQLSVVVPVLLFGELHPGGGAFLIGLLVLVAHLAYRRPARPAVAGYLVASVVPAVTIVVQGEQVWEFVFFPLILGPALLVGRLLRREQARSAELTRLAAELAGERELRARAAVLEERSRISRELHDAVAHNVSVMTLQVGIVRRRLGQLGEPLRAEHEALATAERLGRESVDELRRTVGILRSDPTGDLAPRPSLRRLPELLERVRAAGLPVTLTGSGEPVDLPAAVDMSAYRIVQEALTNTLRHAGPGAYATVDVGWSPRSLTLVVRDRVGTPTTGDGAPALDAGRRLPPAPPAGGHGLVGMRERVEMLAGSLRAGPAAGGTGFEVRAELPLAGPPVVATAAVAS